MSRYLCVAFLMLFCTNAVADKLTELVSEHHVFIEFLNDKFSDCKMAVKVYGKSALAKEDCQAAVNDKRMGQFSKVRDDLMPFYSEAYRAHWETVPRNKLFLQNYLEIIESIKYINLASE